jgi:ABC-type oligopeptide transport system ATPase subunit
MSNKHKPREFDIEPAVLDKVPLIVGLVGPSGSGKTLSALRIATGIQRVSGGDIHVIDTEGKRATHYAPKKGEQPDMKRTFAFKHVPFAAPFSPLDYKDAITQCIKRGAGVIVIDSLSHEHEGPGGVMEWHGQEAERIAAAWRVPRDKAEFPAWKEPKQARRALIIEMTQHPCNFVLCYRAKNKTKPGPDRKLISLGWMPLAGEEFIYEATVNLLLPPASRGVPELEPVSEAQKEIFKVPAQFETLFHENEQLSERHGETMALWASGGAGGRTAPEADNAPRFRGAGVWKGKLLSEVPLDVLERFKPALQKSIDNADGEANARKFRAHMAEIEAAIEAARADSALDGGDSETWDVDATDGEAAE